MLSRGIAGLAAAATLLVPTHAQDSQPPPPAKKASDRPVDVAPVVVTPTRGPESLLEVPHAVSVADEKKLRRLMPQNTPDALREEPGLAIQSSNQGGGSPILRGRSGKDVLLLIDGQRFSNATFRRNHPYMNTVDAFALESIEVARGPASVLYGSDAMGGAINLLLRRRELEGLNGFGGRLHSQYDTVNEGLVSHLDGEAEVDGWGAFAGYTWRRFDDLAPGRVGGDPIHAVDVGGEQVPTGYREQAMNVSLSRRIADHDVVDLALLYSRQWNVPTSERVIPNEKNPSPSDLLRESDPQRLRWWELRWRHEDPGAALESIQAIASLNAPVEGRRRVRTSSPNVVTVERDELTAPGVSLQSAWHLASEHLLTTGVEGYFERIDSDSSSFNSTTGIWTRNASGRYPDGARYDTYGVFAQDEWKPGDGWEWVNGLRYSRIAVDLDFEGLTVGTAGPFGAFDEAFGDVTFATGLSKRLSNETSAYGSISRGFRAPNLDDLAVVGDFAGGNRVPNFDVDPEKVWNFELGANHRGELARAAAAAAVAFYQDLLTNQFAFSQGGTNFFVVDNADRAVIYSLEAWIDRVVIPRDDCDLEHSLFFNAFANVGRNKTANEPISKVPPPEGTLGWRVRSDGRAGDHAPRRWPWYFETFARGALAQRRLAAADKLDPRFPNGGTPAWWTMNLRAGVSVRPGLWLLAGLENLFNYRYRIHGSGIDAPGRNFTIGLDWVF